MTEPRQRIAFHSALENISLELDTLAKKTHAIDEALGAAIGNADAAGALPVTLTQDVDLVRQSADCLRIIMANLAQSTQATPQPPSHLDTQAVIAGVYLAALRDRVSAAPDAQMDHLKDVSDWFEM